MKLFGKITSVVVLAALLAGAIPFAVSAETGESSMENYGLVDDDYSPELPDLEQDYAPTTLASYDPRTTNHTTPIKNQNGNSVCWSFGSIAALEGYVYYNTGLKEDYSEEAMRFVLSEQLPKVNNDDKNYGYYTRSTGGGANFYCAAAYLTSPNNPILNKEGITWVAPNRTSDVPYTSINPGQADYYWPENLDSSYGNVYATGVQYIREETIKDYVLSNGGVYISFYADEAGSYNDDTGGFYITEARIDQLNAEDNRFEPEDKIYTNHGVVVVGWDDDYPKENFKPGRQPDEDGAWLIKNSWGTTYGEDGYCWISYEDFSFNYRNNAAVVTGVDKLSKNETTLSYDFTPMLYSKWYSSSAAQSGLYLANVYDVSDLKSTYDTINKVMFYSADVGSFYRVYIAPLNADGSMPNVSQLGSALAYGTVSGEGYITADFAEPYSIPGQAEKLAVIIKVMSDSAVTPRVEHTCGFYSAQIKPGESYVYSNNQWTDVSGGEATNQFGNFCIRPTLVRRTSVTQDSILSVNEVRYAGEDISVNVNLNGNTLYKITKNGTNLLYEDTDFTRSGNTVTFKKSLLDSFSSSASTNIVFSFSDGADQTLKILPKAQLQSASISGKNAIGQTLTAQCTANVSGMSSLDVTYQWQRSSNGVSWGNISGATGASYTPTSDDRLQYIRVCVSAKQNGNLNYPKTVYSGKTTTKIILYGDVDLNGKVDINDVTQLQLYLAGIGTFTSEQLLAAEVTGDGVINISDATCIQQHCLSGTPFPVEQ